MHIHANNSLPKPEELLKRMERAGVYGGCVFSNQPKITGNAVGTIYETGTTFEERLNEVLLWSKGYEDRIFPVVWIHPEEDNIIENIKKAVDAGVCGFKIICNDLFVDEEKCMKVLREIARLDKPVFFHSGILWDGGVSSKYNKPLNWEALLEIEGLRFSMGHCSWPWIDECIALYGKFLNALATRKTAEMFFDITPGTPEIYREELLKKLYTVGYDVGDNIMFGTDASSANYNSEWVSKWLGIDKKIMDKLGISRKNRESLYYENFMRFLGKSQKRKAHIYPECDDSHGWNACNEDTKIIIKKWYSALSISKKYEEEFNQALEDIKILDTVEIADYDLTSKDGKRNLLSFLYMCEALEKKYAEKGIDEKILMDTLSDIAIWTHTWSSLKAELFLGDEISWLKNHLSMKLFKLGRLQFCMGKAEKDVEGLLTKGENVIEIHIPEGEPLDAEECRKSIKLAEAFFKKYYPEYKYTHFTIHSWLLDTSLREFLKSESNIVKFQELFCIVSENKSDAILRYVFKWKTTREDLPSCACTSGFAQKVKARALSGGDFFENLGILKRE